MGRKRAAPKTEVTIPEEFENYSDEWKEAFTHAVTKGCTEKAAGLYADAHEKDFEASGQTS